jgi:putative transposase
MSRPLRIEFPGAIYHVTSRGDRRGPIFEDDTDRAVLLGVVEEGMGRYDAQVLAYCLMGNHDHFVLHTRQANLSRLMRHLNGVYTQAFNRRHRKVGHLFQCRLRPFWWTGMPTSWRCAVMWNSTLSVRAWWGCPGSMDRSLSRLLNRE